MAKFKGVHVIRWGAEIVQTRLFMLAVDEVSFQWKSEKVPETLIESQVTEHKIRHNENACASLMSLTP